MSAQGFNIESGVLIWHPAIDEADGILMHLVEYTRRDGEKRSAPAGMPTDGRSGGRLADLVAGSRFATDLLKCYVIHDYGCNLAMSYPPGPERDAVRLDYDRTLKEMVEYCNRDNDEEYEDEVIYAGVRGQAKFRAEDPAEPMPELEDVHDLFNLLVPTFCKCKKEK